MISVFTKMKEIIRDFGSSDPGIRDGGMGGYPRFYKVDEEGAPKKGKKMKRYEKYGLRVRDVNARGDA